MTTLLDAADDYPPALVLRATLALDLMAFTEFAFGVVRPNTPFKPNWHLEALAHKLSRGTLGSLAMFQEAKARQTQFSILPHARHSRKGREKSAASHDCVAPRSACGLTVLDNPWRRCKPCSMTISQAASKPPRTWLRRRKRSCRAGPTAGDVRCRLLPAQCGAVNSMHFNYEGDKSSAPLRAINRS
jgi:hypothetical protein